MAENDLSALRGQLVQMIVQQGAILANWLKFAITVQGGLVAGLGFVLSDVETYRILGVIVAIFGALTAYLFAKILCRQSQWGGWYIERCNTLTPTSKIFPDKTESYQPAKIDPNQPVEIAEQIWRMVAAFILFPDKQDEIADQRVGPTGRAVTAFLCFVAVAWIVILLVVLCLNE